MNANRMMTKGDTSQHTTTGAAAVRTSPRGSSSASTGTNPTTGSLSTSHSSTRVTINANKALFQPTDCLALTLQDLGRSVPADIYATPPRKNRSRSRYGYDEDVFADFFANLPRIVDDDPPLQGDETACNHRIMRSLLDTSNDTTAMDDSTTSAASSSYYPSRYADSPAGTTNDARGHRLPPPTSPSVSPTSVLEKIRWRSQRRKEILTQFSTNHSTSSSSMTSRNDVPEVVVHRRKARGEAGAGDRLRQPSLEPADARPMSPPSILSSFSMSTRESRRTASTTTTSPQQPSRGASPTGTATTAAAGSATPNWHRNNNSKNAALAYWQERVTACIQRQGPSSVASARAWMDLGQAQMQGNEYEAAVTSFATAARLFRQQQQQKGSTVDDVNNSPLLLPWAAALHQQGTATSRAQPADKAFQVQALTLLRQALHTRVHALGEDHPDSLATRNALAWVFYYCRQYRTASETFWYVFWKRQAIFGPRHPSVAVAATDLARTFVKLDHLSDAHNFYSIALQIYEQMEVPASNPAVQRLQTDLRALETNAATV